MTTYFVTLSRNLVIISQKKLLNSENWKSLHFSILKLLMLFFGKVLPRKKKARLI